MGEINKWAQGLVEIKPILGWTKEAFNLPCEIKKMAGQNLQLPPPPISNAGPLSVWRLVIIVNTARTSVRWWGGGGIHVDCNVLINDLSLKNILLP